MITVYSKPNCVQCRATKRALDNLGVNYGDIDVATDAEALAHIQGLGYRQVPVVETVDAHWAGYRPDRIAAAAAEIAA